MMNLVKHLLRYDCDYITINDIRGEETKGLWTGVGHWTERSSVYSRGVARGASCQEVLKTVELVAQMRSTTEYDVGDLDHYYEFLGGVRRTIELLTGEGSRRCESTPRASGTPSRAWKRPWSSPLGLGP